MSLGNKYTYFDNKRNYYQLKSYHNEDNYIYDPNVAKLMYELQGSNKEIILYIPEEDFFDKDDNSAISLIDILMKYNIDPNVLMPEKEIDSLTPQWILDMIGSKVDRKQKLLDFSRSNKARFTDPKTPYEKYFHIKNFNDLVYNVKQILKCYLPTDDMLLNYKDALKYHLRYDEQQKRIFSFNWLRYVVNHNPEKFNKIKFPKRAMIIENHNRILTIKKTIDYIDNNFKFIIDNQGELINELSNPEYKVIICSTYIKPNLIIDNVAIEQLKELCMIAPFDTSANTGGNIFGVNDEAWIIDGKNKATGNIKNCLTHIKSYE